MKKDIEKENLTVLTDEPAAAEAATAECALAPEGSAEKKPKDKKDGKVYRFFHSETFAGYLFLLPWLIGFCAFVAYPIIQTLIFSFGDVEICPGEINTTFIGFDNYAKALLKDSNFTKALGDYATEIILYVPVITVISLILAMLLNSKLKGTGFFRTVFFFPVIITSGPVIKMFIDQGVASFPGIEDLIDFTQLAKWEMFWKITLPALNPTIVLNVVFTVVMQSIFSLNPIITKIQTDMNATDGSGGYGYASAMAWIYFIVMLLILGLAVLIFKKHEKREKRVRRLKRA